MAVKSWIAFASAVFLSVSLIAPAVAGAQEAVPETPVVETVVEAVVEPAQPAPTPQAAIDWHARMDERRAVQQRAAEMRRQLLLENAQGQPQEPAQ